VGTLSTAETGTHTFTYTLGTGGDNTRFTLSGNQLLTNDAFDIATQASYTITVTSTDEGNRSVTKSFPIAITDDPALTRSGTTLTVTGTAGADTFSYTAARCGTA